MSDFYLSLQYMGPGKIEKIGQGLRSDPRDTAPGWYIRSYGIDGYDEFVKYTKIEWQHVLNATQALERGLGEQALSQPVCAAEAQRVTDLERLRVIHETNIEKGRRFLEENGYTVSKS